MEIKMCNKCKRELPKNTDYFFKKKDTKDGFTNRCKECQGYEFTDKLTKMPKVGHKFCIKCNRELPLNNLYFPMDSTCKDGLRNVCRECGQDGHFMKKGYIPKRVWADEENELFIKRYPHYTNEELIDKFYPQENKKTIEDRAFRLSCTNTKTEETYIRSCEAKIEKMTGENSPHWGIPKSKEVRRKISLANKEYYKNNPHPCKGRTMSDEQRLSISNWKKDRQTWVGKNNPRHKDPLFGKRNGRWLGGRTPLYFELRSETRKWQLDSMKYCNYRCVITGGEFDHVHHLYPFRKIVDEVFENLKLNQRKRVEDYSEEEFQDIKIELHSLHEKYGHGVCLDKNVHKVFHDIYGYTDNTPKQFEEFKIRIKLGELDNYFKEKNLIINI